MGVHYNFFKLAHEDWLTDTAPLSVPMRERSLYRHARQLFEEDFADVVRRPSSFVFWREASSQRWPNVAVDHNKTRCRKWLNFNRGGEYIWPVQRCLPTRKNISVRQWQRERAWCHDGADLNYTTDVPYMERDRTVLWALRDAGIDVIDAATPRRRTPGAPTVWWLRFHDATLVKEVMYGPLVDCTHPAP
eukprot:gene12478-52459_t